jgi:hypothetical protein
MFVRKSVREKESINLNCEYEYRGLYESQITDTQYMEKQGSDFMKTKQRVYNVK